MKILIDIGEDVDQEDQVLYPLHSCRSEMRSILRRSDVFTDYNFMKRGCMREERFI